MLRGGYISRFNNESIKRKLRQSTTAQGKRQQTKRRGKGSKSRRSKSRRRRR